DTGRMGPSRRDLKGGGEAGATTRSGPCVRVLPSHPILSTGASARRKSLPRGRQRGVISMKRPVCALLLGLGLTTAGPALGAPDGITLSVARGPAPGDVTLSWIGAPADLCTVYRSTKYSPNAGIGNALTTTSGATWSDRPPAGGIVFYEVTVAPFWTRDISA